MAGELWLREKINRFLASVSTGSPITSDLHSVWRQAAHYENRLTDSRFVQCRRSQLNFCIKNQMWDTFNCILGPLRVFIMAFRSGERHSSRDTSVILVVTWATCHVRPPGCQPQQPHSQGLGPACPPWHWCSSVCSPDCTGLLVCSHPYSIGHMYVHAYHHRIQFLFSPWQIMLLVCDGTLCVLMAALAWSLVARWHFWCLSSLTGFHGNCRLCYMWCLLFSSNGSNMRVSNVWNHCTIYFSNSIYNNGYYVVAADDHF